MLFEKMKWGVFCILRRERQYFLTDNEIEHHEGTESLPDNYINFADR
jgi:hypothetical protein